MLECSVLDNMCIQTIWNWIYENWSWGFFIAVASLFFTTRALKKTDKSNKLAELSLALTKRSTDIAEESLEAAKKSINTSIEIYNKQKRDSLIKNKKQLNRERYKTALMIKMPLITLYDIYMEIKEVMTIVINEKYIREKPEKYIKVIKTDAGHEIRLYNKLVGEWRNFHIDDIDYYTKLFVNTYYDNSSCIDNSVLKKCTKLLYTMTYGTGFFVSYYISVLSNKDKEKTTSILNDINICNSLLSDINKSLEEIGNLFEIFTHEKIKEPFES